jgi:TRAP-type C4-dicarboxylate transport system permease small subunit
MRRDWILFVLGVIVFFIPLLGFPQKFDTVVLVISGLLIMIFSLRNVRLLYLKEADEKAPLQ